MLVGKELGPFRVERELGSGAMGTVYLAENRDTGQRVAIKMIGIGQLNNDTALARFEREANILKQLKHPNIVRLIGNGRWKKMPFIAMEYVEGESLDHVLGRRARFSWEEVVAIGQQLCQALQHSHDKGIIHRDLKPSNLMVLADGTVKLTDFGIAKDTDVTALTAQNVTVGTAAYMSPEQCKGERNLTPKSDLYSLGVMFFELLTGRKPFVKDSPIDMFMAHVNEEPPRAGKLALDIPAKLDVLVRQLMEKKPEYRPRDAAMVASVLDEVVQDALDLRSAGVDAVTARRADRPRGTAVADETDKDAARTLRGALLKKKIRKKAKPLHERGWFVLAAICAFLFAAFAGLYFVLRPPSAESLYTRAKTFVDAKDRDRALPALQQYLALYGNQSDTATQQVRRWYEEIETEQREQILYKRVYSKLNLAGDDEATKVGREALRAEDDGDFDKANEYWAEMERKYADHADPDERVWAWLARKKRADLADVARREKQLEDGIVSPATARKPECEAERYDLEALRYEAFGDLPAARDRFTKVKEDLAKAFEQRPWVLLACRKARDLKATAPNKGPEEEKAKRVELVKARLKQAADLANSGDFVSGRKARALLEEIAGLYGNDPDADVKALAQGAAPAVRPAPEPGKP